MNNYFIKAYTWTTWPAPHSRNTSPVWNLLPWQIFASAHVSWQMRRSPLRTAGILLRAGFKRKPKSCTLKDCETTVGAAPISGQRKTQIEMYWFLNTAHSAVSTQTLGLMLLHLKYRRPLEQNNSESQPESITVKGTGGLIHLKMTKHIFMEYKQRTNENWFLLNHCGGLEEDWVQIRDGWLLLVLESSTKI